MNIYFLATVAIIVIMSIVAYIAYAIDKFRAIKGRWRIPEKVLLLLALCGGAIGATIAMYTIRHKNRKWYFVAVNYICIALHVALLVLTALI